MIKEKIALLTYREHPELPDGEQLLPPAFAAAGIEAMPAPWDGDVDWSQFTTIIIRACWNYHLNRPRFLRWLDDRVSDGITVWNSPEVIKWNTDKHYLLDLEKKGIKLVPTFLIETGNYVSLQEVLESNNWDEAVIKPTIGASSFELQKFTKNAAQKVEIDRKRSWLVQKFCSEINSEGEYSFLFYGRQYSHSVLKKPKDGEYRSQPDFGGKESGVNPSEAVVDYATGILRQVDGPILYTRVDGIFIGGVFHLMELEMAEPYLFFERHPDAPNRFVEAYKRLTREY